MCQAQQNGSVAGSNAQEKLVLNGAQQNGSKAEKKEKSDMRGAQQNESATGSKAEKNEKPDVNGAQQMEKLDRGVVAVRQYDGNVFISWRLLKKDSPEVSFNVYRVSDSEKPVKLNKTPIDKVTWFVDSTTVSSKTTTYYICENGFIPLKSNNYTLCENLDLIVASAKKEAKKELERFLKTENSDPDFSTKKDNETSKSTNAAAPYISVPLQIPPAGEVNGQAYTYSANDASVGDLDGDGKYEIILKWEPSITRNPPQTGFTGMQIIDAYKLDGTLLWRINLGINIRAGAAYTQFLVYDMDGDGKAEILCKTADGTIDGKGNIVGDGTKDWRTKDPASPMYGKIVDGPEYLTVFDGLTGKALATETYLPTRYPLDGWGGRGGNGGNDTTGGRPDRFTAGIAYLDGVRPSAVFVRGWYGRTVAAAWDYRNGKLTSRWVFDSKDETNPFSGQGNHSVSVADVDGDGKDEFCVGAMTIDDDGKGLYSTGLRHGDALHIADMDPSRPGLEVFGVHENEGKSIAFQTPGVALFDAANGKVLFSLGPGVDVGRGVAADIDPTHPGFENWGGPGGLRDVKGNTISDKSPSSTNFVIWWDGDLTRELLDKNRIDKWDWKNNTTINLLTAEGCVSNNGTKATPCLSADIMGDWREEVIWRTEDNTELRIYTTTIPTSYRMPSFMEESQYRLSIAWQNVSYNQPPHPSCTIENWLLQSGSKSVGKTQSILYSDDFSKGLSDWVIEKNSDSTEVKIENNILDIVVPKGFTMWYKKPLEGNMTISFEAYVVKEGGKYDRVSDLNCFWMANDPENPVDFFARSLWRNGVFGKYYSLKMYYVGYGGNSNTTTRFRKYDGDYEAFLQNSNRPDIIKEYTDSAHLLTPNKWCKIEIIMDGNHIKYLFDGETLFDHIDNTPYKKGYFGIRTTTNHMKVRNFKVKN
jgi:rhamnogalacturonan endolyase